MHAGVDTSLCRHITCHLSASKQHPPSVGPPSGSERAGSPAQPGPCCSRWAQSPELQQGWGPEPAWWVPWFPQQVLELSGHRAPLGEGLASLGERSQAQRLLGPLRERLRGLPQWGTGRWWGWCRWRCLRWHPCIVTAVSDCVHPEGGALAVCRTHLLAVQRELALWACAARSPCITSSVMVQAARRKSSQTRLWTLQLGLCSIRSLCHRMQV